MKLVSNPMDEKQIDWKIADPSKLSLLACVGLLWVVFAIVSGCSKTKTATELELPSTDEWHAIYVSGAHVGYSKTSTRTITRDGVDLLETKNESKIVLQRNGQSTAQDIRLTSLADQKGVLHSFTSQTSSGASTTKTTGRRNGNRLTLETFTGNASITSTTLLIPEDCGDFFAVENLLKRSQLTPNSKLELKSIIPIVNSVASIKLHIGDFQDVKLIGQTKKLLHIRSTTTLAAGQSIHADLWVTASGVVLKSTVGKLQTNIRTTESIAKAFRSDNLDLTLESMVSIDPPLQDPHVTKKIVYKASVLTQSENRLFIDSGSQKTIIKDDSLLIEVLAIRPESPLFPIDDQPTDADRKPNNLVQSNDPLIQRMAQSVLPKSSDPWEVARALERFVYDLVQEKNFSTAFASAAEVAKSKSGDCTEHSVLLAALCRARKIPARTAVGLVYVPSKSAFGYHMWSEVWIQDRWIPMDATLARGGIGAAHIKVRHTNLSQGSGFESFLPVINLIGNLKLQVISRE